MAASVQSLRATHRDVPVLLLALCSLAAGCGSPPLAPTAVMRPAPPPLTARTRFLAFGDSITAGTTSPAVTTGPMAAGLPESYPFKLQQLMFARYTSQVVTVENAGRPAEAAVDGVRRFPGALQAFSPEVVILLHGVNDVSFQGMGAVNRVAEYVNAMARDARLAGADVVICTLPPNRPGGLRSGDPVVIAAYNDALRGVARGEGALLADFDREVDIGLIGVDGLHPTEAGYTRMAEVLLQVLRQRYEVRR